MTIIAENLKFLIYKHRTNVNALARELGIQQPTLHRILTGETNDPRTKSVKLLAEHFGLDTETLRYKDITKAQSNISLTPKPKGVIPIISMAQAGDWAKIIDEFNPDDTEEWVSSFKRHSKNSFAVKVEGISMQNHGHKESFDPGDIILADPERTADNGSLVIVRLEDEKEATFKKLYIESGQYYLKPLNPDWRPQIIPINGNATICGVVFQKVVDFI